MSWPTDRDYNEAIQNLATTCGDERLRRAEAERNAYGVPQPYSGNFADVYAVRGADGRRWAVKCFKRQTHGLYERYQAIDAHLRQAQLPFTTPFKFVEQGLRIRGAWYPVVRMEWIEGQRLNDFVQAALDRPQALEQLADLWPKVSARLQAVGVAHADLQHGNVLLVPRGPDGALSLKLIDYDGMYVPAFAGQPSQELGHACFQHPQRARDRVFNADLDRFSHLTIFAALRCLRLDGRRLWQRYDNGDNLLFRERDFLAPQSSELLHELWALRCSAARAVVGRLVLATQQPLAEVPWLHEFVQGREVAPLVPPEEARVRELLGQAPVQIARPQGAAKAELTATQTRPAGSRSDAPAERGSRPVQARSATAASPPQTATFGSAAGTVVAAELADETVVRGDAPNALSPVWAWCRDNALVLAVSLVGLLAVGGLAGAMLYSSRDEADRTASERVAVHAAPPALPNEQAVDAPLPDEQPPPSVDPDHTAGVSPTLEQEPAAIPAEVGVAPPLEAPTLFTLQGHRGSVRSLAFSPDGRWLASSDEVGQLCFWDATNGGQYSRVDISGGAPHVLQFSPFDPGLLVVGCEDGRVSICHSGAPLVQTPPLGNAHAAAISAISFIELTLFAGDRDGRLKSWDGFAPEFSSVADFGPGRVAALATAGTTLRAAIVRSGPGGDSLELVHCNAGVTDVVLADEVGRFHGAVFSPDANALCYFTGDGSVVVLDATAGLEVGAWTLPAGGPKSVALSFDGALLAVGVAGGSVRLWNVVTAEELADARWESAAGQHGPVTALSISRNGQRAAAGFPDGAVLLWELTPEAQTLADGAPAWRPIQPPGFPGGLLPGMPGGIADSPPGGPPPGLPPGDGPLVPRVAQPNAEPAAPPDAEPAPPQPSAEEESAAVGEASVVTVRPEARSAETVAAIQWLAFALDSRHLASLERDGTSRVWDARRLMCRETYSANPAWGRVAAFNFPSQRIATLSSPSVVEVWHPNEAAPAYVLDDHESDADALTCVEISPEGSYLAAGSDEGSIFVWELLRGRLFHDFPAGDSRAEIAALAFSPDCSFLASGAADGSLSLWTFGQTEPIGTVRKHASRITVLSFGPAQQVLSASADGQATVWRTDTLAEQFSLPAQGSPLTCAAFHPQGVAIATGAADGSLCVWRADAGTPFAILVGGQSAVAAAAFSPDGKLVAAAREDGTIELWRIPRLRSAE